MTTMQGFNFGIRHSASPSIQEETQSRYIPSSVYSGPGPAEESAPPQSQQHYLSNGQQRRSTDTSAFAGADSRYNDLPAQLQIAQPRSMSDPVTMHLLMETAISDSKEFEIVSFEELEDLKRRQGFLRTKLDGARRQLVLEKKMQEAAHSINKLYIDDDHNSPSDYINKRSSFYGRRSDSVAKSEADLDVSREKVGKLTADVQALEEELAIVERRIMQHTAGILQSTHRGLKKNIRKNELPRSPESMLSQPRSLSNADAANEFDERSLYQVPEYVHEYSRSTASRSSRRNTRDVQPIEDVATRLHVLNTQLHGIVQQKQLAGHFGPPPEPAGDGVGGQMGTQIQAHLAYMSQGLEALQKVGESQPQTSLAGSEQQVQNLTSRLRGMLERTNSISKSPSVGHEPEAGPDIHSQLEYSASVLDRLNQRVDALLEQKDILTRQIQQQRELNSKSDAQRDAHIRDLTEELEEAKQLQSLSDREMQQAQDQMSLLMEQLDLAKQNEQLLEKQRGLQEGNALEAEKAARKENETKLMQELESRQHALTQLQMDHEKIQHDFELKSQSHIQQTNDLTTSKGQLELDLRAASEQLALEKKNTIAAREQAEQQLQSNNEALAKAQAETREIETQLATVQTELTMAKAELDASYGSRAQRAADVSLNPEVKKQIDTLTEQNSHLEKQLEFLSQQHEAKGVGSAELQNKVNSLQKELKDTIEDYEVMTKASIDFEKERDELEALIDSLNTKCDRLEDQANEDKVKWLGVKDNLPPETTSTMVLKNEFKKMMRDSRAESMKMLKAEQEERRRLESIIRGLKKESNAQTPAKAPPKPDSNPLAERTSTPTPAPSKE